MKALKVAVVGATGAVGTQLLSILEQRKFPVAELTPFASARSQGKPVSLNGRSYPCQVLSKGCFQGIDIAFFDASDAVSQDWVLEAAQAGTWVVDNSAVFRLEKDILLVVPEVNGELLEKRLKAAITQKSRLSPRERIISGPNCSTVQMVVALKPIQARWGIRRVVVSTYQSTSGAGAAAMEELREQAPKYLKGEQLVPRAFAHQIAFNCIPHIGGFKDDGYTSEEQKMIAETRKLLDMPQLRISATAVRVPTFSSHAESINVECESPLTVQEVREALRAHPGIILQDDPERKIYPMNLTSSGDLVEGASGRDAVYVGRIRKDPSIDNGINMWVVSDNLRKGAALNAVQIGEMVLKALG